LRRSAWENDGCSDEKKSMNGGFYKHFRGDDVRQKSDVQAGGSTFPSKSNGEFLRPNPALDLRRAPFEATP
jgi:hypothetical protein